MNNCTQCSDQVERTTNFCSECGLRLGDTDQSFWAPLKALIYEKLNFDRDHKPLSILRIIFSPSFLKQQFLEGRRGSDTLILKIYFMLSTLLFGVFGIFGIFDVFGQIDVVDTFSLYELSLYGEYQPQTAIRPLYSTIMYVLLPAFGCLLTLFYWQEHFSKNLIFAIHLQSFAYIMLIALLYIESLAPENLLTMIIQASIFLGFCWYIGKAFKTIYQESWALTLIKSIAAICIYIGIIFFSFEFVQRFQV